MYSILQIWVVAFFAEAPNIIWTNSFFDVKTHQCIWQRTNNMGYTFFLGLILIAGDCCSLKKKIVNKYSSKSAATFFVFSPWWTDLQSVESLAANNRQVNFPHCKFSVFSGPLLMMTAAYIVIFLRVKESKSRIGNYNTGEGGKDAKSNVSRPTAREQTEVFDANAQGKRPKHAS